MTDNEATVTVPVSLIERLHAESVMGAGNRAALAALLPKPAPRLRVVDLDAMPQGTKRERVSAYDIEAAPDVMTLIEQAMNDSDWDRDTPQTVFNRIRTAIEEATR